MPNYRNAQKHLGSLLFLLCFAVPTFSQQLVFVSDGRHTITLKAPMKIAYLLDTNSIRLADRIPTVEGETIRHGIIFKTGKIIRLDTKSIYLENQSIPYKEISYVYVDKKYLGAKIPGVAIMAFSAALLASNFKLTEDVATPLFENSRMFFGVAGLLLGGALTFGNYSPLLKAEYAPLKYTVVY